MTPSGGRQKSAWVLFFMVVLGMILGSALGEALEEILPDGVVKRFFVESVDWGLDAQKLDLVVFSITLGFSIKVNVMAVLGVILSIYLFRWY